MTSIEELVRAEVMAGINEVLRPYLPRLARPECRSYSFAQAAHVIGCSDRHVSKLVAQGRLPLVPHMGAKKIIPRAAVEAFVDGTFASSQPGDAGGADVPTITRAAS